VVVSTNRYWSPQVNKNNQKTAHGRALPGMVHRSKRLDAAKTTMKDGDDGKAEQGCGSKKKKNKNKKGKKTGGTRLSGPTARNSSTPTPNRKMDPVDGRCGKQGYGEVDVVLHKGKVGVAVRSVDGFCQ